MPTDPPLDASGAGVCALDASGRALFVNERLASLLGRAAGDVQGRPFLELVEPAARPAAQALVERLRTSGGQGDLPLEAGDGSRRWVVAAATAAGEGVLTLLLVDITARKQEEDRLRRVEEHYRVLAETAEDHIFVIDRDDRVAYVNQAAARQLRATPDLIVGRRRTEIFPPEVAERQGQNLRKVFETGEPLYAEGRTLYLMREVWLGTWLAPVKTAGGEVRAVLGLSRDMTEQRQAQAELLRAQKLEAIGLLAGGIAHDFNNNLTAILGYIEVIRRQVPDDSPFAPDLNEVHQAAERSASLVRRLLAFGRRQVTQPRPLNLNTLVEGLASMLRRLIGERIDIVTTLAPDLWAVRVDPGEIEQVVINLALNARDAMPDGGVLTISTSNVEPSAPRQASAPAGPGVRLEIRDTGMGMPPHVKEHVFEPFFTTKPAGEGTGLGLSTAYGIIRQLGGLISVESEAGQGTAFSVHLPARPGETESVAAAGTAAPGEATAVRPTSTRRPELILIVEDEDSVRRFATRALQHHGFVVLEAARPEEALALVTAGHRPTLVLCDVVMPQINGPELAGRLRELLPGLIVAYMSGYPRTALTQHLVEPSSHLITKPFTIAALTAYVDEALGSRT